MSVVAVCVAVVVVAGVVGSVVSAEAQNEALANAKTAEERAAVQARIDLINGTNKAQSYLNPAVQQGNAANQQMAWAMGMDPPPKTPFVAPEFNLPKGKKGMTAGVVQMVPKMNPDGSQAMKKNGDPILVKKVVRGPSSGDPNWDKVLDAWFQRNPGKLAMSEEEYDNVKKKYKDGVTQNLKKQYDEQVFVGQGEKGALLKLPEVSKEIDAYKDMNIFTKQQVDNINAYRENNAFSEIKAYDEKLNNVKEIDAYKDTNIYDQGINAYSNIDTNTTLTKAEYEQDPLYTPMVNNLEDLQNTPGYQYQLQQGLDSANNSAAASGSMLSGRQLQALNKVGQDVASTGYAAAWQRAQQAYQQAFTNKQNLQSTVFSQKNVNQTNQFNQQSTNLNNKYMEANKNQDNQFKQTLTNQTNLNAQQQQNMDNDYKQTLQNQQNQFTQNQANMDNKFKQDAYNQEQRLANDRLYEQNIYSQTNQNMTNQFNQQNTNNQNKFNQETANSGNLFNRLNLLQQQGQDAATQSATLQANAGKNRADLTIQHGNNQANFALQQGANDAAMVNGITSAVQSGASMYAGGGTTGGSKTSVPATNKPVV